MAIDIRPATETNCPAIVAFDDSVVEMTSPMDVARLRQLATATDYLRVVEVDGTPAGLGVSCAVCPRIGDRIGIVDECSI